MLLVAVAVVAVAGTIRTDARRRPRSCCSTRSAEKGAQCPREPSGIVEPGEVPGYALRPYPVVSSVALKAATMPTMCDSMAARATSAFFDLIAVLMMSWSRLRS
jgi:hypothetical protein